jgi:hypothetical protein
LISIFFGEVEITSAVS